MIDEELIRTSPFAARATDRIVFDKAEKNGRIKGKISSAFLKEPQLLVIEALRRYTFLNAHMLAQILERDIGYPKESMKQLLSRMTKARYVTRFRIAYTDALNVEHRSSYIYTLADNLFNNGKVELQSSTAQSYLAFNQFHIAVTQKYRNVMYGFYCKGSDTIDGAVSFTSEGKRVTINVLTMRKGMTGQSITDKFTEAMTEDSRNATLLVLCESELHALEIDRYYKQQEGMGDKRVFYMCDSATAGESMPFENVVRVKAEQEYEIVTIPVDDVVNMAGEEE